MDVSDLNATLAVALPFAVAGAAWGLVADRIASRWPRHDDGTIRPPGLRTAAVVATGALALGALPTRFDTPLDLALLTAWFAALILLMATDLDQRLLPDVITLPLIPVSLLVLVAGWNPLLAGKDLGVASGIAAGVAVPAFLAVTSRLFRGGLGMGDVKLAVSLGLVLGLYRFVGGFLVGALAFAAVAVVLLATRRIGLRSAIPFGPMLVLAGFAGALLESTW